MLQRQWVKRTGRALAGVGVGAAVVYSLPVAAEGSLRERLPALAKEIASSAATGVLSARERAEDMWDQAYGAVTAPPGQHAERGSLQERVATRVADWCGDPARRQAVVVLGGRTLLDRLLVSANNGDYSAEAQRALINLLEDGTTAVAVLRRPGAIPALVELAGKHPLLGRALTEAGVAAAMPTAALLEDIYKLVEQASGGKGRTQQLLAVQLLGALAEASLVNAGKIASMRGGPALAQVAMEAITGKPDRHMQGAVTRAMAVLVRDCTLSRPLGLADWLEPLLYIAADAAARRDAELAAEALDAVALCVARGGAEMRAAVQASNLLPLLDRLAMGRERDARMQRSILSLIAALAQPETNCLPEPERDKWTRRLLTWLCTDLSPSPVAPAPTPSTTATTPSPTGKPPATPSGVTAVASSAKVEQKPPGMAESDQLSVEKGTKLGGDAAGEEAELLRFSAAGALAALASEPGPEGLAVAHAWLGELLITLSRNVTAYNSLSPVAPASGTSDLELVQAVAVGPTFARAIASDLRAVSEGNAAAAVFAEPPADEDITLAPPRALQAAAVGAEIEAEAAADILQRALQVLCALIASDDKKQRWALSCGILPLLERLTLYDRIQEEISNTDEIIESPPDAVGVSAPGGGVAERPPESKARDADAETGTAGASPRLAVDAPKAEADVGIAEGMGASQGSSAREAKAGSEGELRVGRGVGEPSADKEDGLEALPGEDLSPAVRKQVARLLAMLTADPAGQRLLRRSAWLPWLHSCAGSQDCQLSSHAQRALLHLESGEAAEAWGRGDWDWFSAGESEPGASLVDKVSRIATRAKQELERSIFPAAPPPPLPSQPPEASEGSEPAPGPETLDQAGDHKARPRLVLRDGVHLFDPAAEHHHILAREGAASNSPGAPAVDVVFIHGIRGGPFVTWRSERDSLPESAQPQSAESAAAAGEEPPGGWLPSRTRAAATAARALEYLTNWTPWGAEGTAGERVDGGFPGGTTPGDRDGSGNAEVSGRPEAADADPQTGYVGWVVGYLNPWEWGWVRSRSGTGLPPNPNSGSPKHPHPQKHPPCQPPDPQSEAEDDSVAEALESVTEPLGPQSSDARRQLREERDAAAVVVVASSGGEGSPGVVAETLPGTPPVPHPDCWPSGWLPGDVPEARLLSLEYLAPVTGWEGESLPVHGTVGQLLDRLTAAGVGARPVVFICHSMGGLLVKEMLARAAELGAPEHRAAIARATVGIVFYATPHYGSRWAEWGWNLRYVGASPAAAVLHLRPGPHLETCNQLLARWHEEGKLEVLSLVEGRPTYLGSLLPRTFIVPRESACPGYGECIEVDEDHINICKPGSREELSYQKLVEFLRKRVEEVKGSSEGAGTEDGEREEEDGGLERVAAAVG